jgi:hypothetical protein
MDSAESSRSNEPVRDPETLSSSFKDSAKIQAPEQARKTELAVDQSERVEAAQRTRPTSRRISAGIARSLIMASIGVLTGIAASSAWEAHSGEAKQMARSWALSLISSANQYFTQTESKSEQNGGNSTVASTRESPQPSPAQNSAPLAAAEAVQQLKAMSQDLFSIRDMLEKLAVAQEQMTKKMASLQAVEQEIKQKMSSALAAPAVPIVPTPIDPKRKNGPQAAAPQQPPRPRLLTDWWVTGTRNGTVFVEGNDDIYQAAPGVPLPGLGPVKRIIHQDGRWAVVTAKGIIAAKRDRIYFDNLKELNIE